MIFSILFPFSSIVHQRILKDISFKHLNWCEVARFGIYGGLIHGPLVYKWIHFCTHLMPSTRPVHIIGKVLLDQICFAPVILSTFFVSLASMEGMDPNEILQKLPQKITESWGTGCLIWPFIGAFDYRYIPQVLKTSFIGICTFFWFIFLANVRSRPTPWKPPLLRLWSSK